MYFLNILFSKKCLANYLLEYHQSNLDWSICTEGLFREKTGLPFSIPCWNYRCHARTASSETV
jgi:hypothetical protein